MKGKKYIIPTKTNTQTNKQTNKQDLVTKENYQTQYLRSANMTTKEVGGGKKDKYRKFGMGWVRVGWEELENLEKNSQSNF